MEEETKETLLTADDLIKYPKLAEAGLMEGVTIAVDHDSVLEGESIVDAYYRIAFVESENFPIVDHTLSKEDLDNNPELAEQGLKEGDTVGIPELPEDAVVEEGQVPEEAPETRTENRMPAPNNDRVGRISK